MKNRLCNLRWVATLLLVCVCAPAQTQTKDRWADWKPFLGEWQGEGSGEPGTGKGEFSFAPGLQGTILVRHNFADYPASKDNPAYRHDDLMVISKDDNGRTRADYWDNEGHVIHYTVDLSPGKLVFLSEAAQPGPRYRLTYAKTGDTTLMLTFEIASSGDPCNFKKYIEAQARRKP